MMTAIIIEDETKNKQILEKLLNEYCKEVEIIGWAASVEDGINIINNNTADLVFFDIEIENGTSFDVLEKLTNLNFESIFITAYGSYAIKAFKYNAIDYLLKPVNIDELVAAVAKAKINKYKNKLELQMESLLQMIKHKAAPQQKIVIHNNQALEFINITDILYLEASESYTKFVLSNNKKVISAKNIKHYEDLLDPETFIRVHHSYIANLNHIKQYVKGRGGYLIMQNDFKIEVSVRKKNDFLSRF